MSAKQKTPPRGGWASDFMTTLFKQQRNDYKERYQHPYQYSGAAEAAQKIFHCHPSISRIV